MQKKSFDTLALMVIMCCLTTFLLGCNANENDDNADSVNVISPTQTISQNNETHKPDLISPIQTASPSEKLQTPDSDPANPINPSESSSATTVETGLDDGTEVRLIVSGQELVLRAVMKGGEALVPDLTSVFGKLKDAGGIDSAGFWSVYYSDINVNIMNAVIENAWYSIKIAEGEYSFICNDETIPLTVPAQQMNGVFYVPLLAIAEAINATVEWDEATQTISFFY